jgi:flagellar hook-associated protein 2
LEDRYYRQFTAMEKAIQQMNSQSMWLMQQFGTYGRQ